MKSSARSNLSLVSVALSALVCFVFGCPYLLSIFNYSILTALELRYLKESSPIFLLINTEGSLAMKIFINRYFAYNG